MKSFEIPYYHDYISPEICASLKEHAQNYKGVEGLVHIGASGGLETPESMKFLCELYEKTKGELAQVLEQRILDRKFIDERTASCYKFNQSLKIDFESSDYKTILGHEDSRGRVVIGPLSTLYAKKGGGKPISEIPEYLKGNHVTLFGPPDNAKLSINAMNAYHRKLKGEPQIVEELLKTHISTPKWGADDEDSKTPLREDLISAGENLTHCFDRTIKVVDDKSNKTYELAEDKLSLPIKRFPGLALPCFFLFYKNNPIPLHLYDFALHLFKNWHNKEALAFYVPKLENEEEARYIRIMLETAEKMIAAIHKDYVVGSIRLMIVLENPRAILRVNEIMDELYPYFAGASLGWHDYLGSTARLFKEDGNYRIPVKADPNIVIKYIKGSHDLLAAVVGSRGGIKVGGMYGILPTTPDLFSESFQVTIKGYIKDIITQMKRDLTGFWVAHPDFVRIGLALVEAWKFHQQGDKSKLDEMVTGLLDKKYHKEILDFIHGPDITGLDVDDDMYVRSLLVADIKESNFIANNHPDEVRYNIFQSLQYITDWLSGNGCVALPAQIAGTPVRVMDDLATAERSRWEVWHEIYHGRFTLQEFLKIAHEELHFIRKDLSDDTKIVQVKWDERTEKWYPIAMKLMIRLMTDKKPVEFATELLLPFTIPYVREASDPWAAVSKIDKEKFAIPGEIERFNYYFEMCGAFEFAASQTKNVVVDLSSIEKSIMMFDKKSIIEAASFHGDIGEGKKTLDKMATSEQSLVFNTEEKVKSELKDLGKQYLAKFGVKFLVSAKGKSGEELLTVLKTRINNSEAQELDNARNALFEITKKRVMEHPLNSLNEKFQQSLNKHKIKGAMVAIATPEIQTVCLGDSTPDTWFELASLSKTFASAFAIEYFTKNNISIETSVNTVLKNTKSTFRLSDDNVQIKHLMNHSALNMHYVKGYPANGEMPKIESLLSEVAVINPPGEKFKYSGAGFITLEHLIEAHSGKSIKEITKDFWPGFSFEQKDLPNTKYAHGFTAEGVEVPGTRLMFPAFAAGGMGTGKSMASFLNALTDAYQNLSGSGPISHDTARLMLHSADNGCMKFMGSEMGLGVFVAEAGDNKLAIHQGANDGFRAIYIHCFHGPDIGKGFVIQSNGELNAVLFISEISQMLLKELNFSGIDFTKFKENFNVSNLSQEEVVNIGYKNLIFDAFLPALPEEIIEVGALDPLSKTNLAIGGKVLEVTNQKFARATNLLSPFEPFFDPKLFGKQGKIMDSWETVRHNQKECDQMVFELKKPSEINFVTFSTKYHLGNQAQYAKVEGQVDNNSEWIEIAPKTHLEGHAFMALKANPTKLVFKYIRVSNYPDGGLSRLGLYKDLDEKEIKSYVYKDEIKLPTKPLSIVYKPDAAEIKKNLARFKKGDEINVASMAFGGNLVKASNEHYGPAILVVSPYSPMSMFDGLESARSRAKDHSEECIVSLAWGCKVHRIEMDFIYFVNNNPLFVSIEGRVNNEWVEIIPKVRVKAFAGNAKSFEIKSDKMFDQIKVKTFPDGGINRLKVFSFI
ncbi:serine hydrolase [Bacteriovorax sp. PP10]|uniref:Serine hydrolase n=1 Tax=Bacteriovorax antarcticus TaxID=3088717 RepID=A0ABU5VXD2_9BACT|nr:serine hydrolase [Bacteriovorax sp. PP10]MEA9357730.1 serine hydrolase [Bacteriovorax sp. PP10]